MASVYLRTGWLGQNINFFADQTKQIVLSVFKHIFRLPDSDLAMSKVVFPMTKKIDDQYNFTANFFQILI